jgi:hypothetical protein
MGYDRHHGMMVTGFREGQIVKAHAEAERIGLQVSPMVTSAVNGWVSFAVFPDGSKEGWTDSDAGETRRAEFIAWLVTNRHECWVDWVLFQYGDDERETIICDHSDKEPPHAP